MNIEQEKEIVASLSSLYPMQKFEEEAIDVVLDALSKRIPCSECERGVIVNGVEIPKNCAECPAGTYEYNENDERCFVCGFIKSQHPWECEHAEIDGIDTTKMRAHFCPIAEVAIPHWISVTERLPRIGEYVLCMIRQRYRGQFHVCHYVDKDKYINHPYFDWRHNGFPDVVAWMPLPEPMRMEKQ